MGVRTHIVLPDELLKEIDAIAGKRKRSEFIEEAIRTKLRMDKQRRAIQALKESRGVLNPADFLSLEDYENASDYIAAMRREDAEHRRRQIEKAAEDDAVSS